MHIRQATEQEIEEARAAYANDEVNIDDDALATPIDGGIWVQAWVLVRKE